MSNSTSLPSKETFMALVEKKLFPFFQNMTQQA